MRLKDLLGVSLEELKTLLTAEEARAEVRAQLRREDVDPERRRELLARGARPHRPPARARPPPRRRAAQLEHELSETRKRVRRKIRELDAHAGAARSRRRAPSGRRRAVARRAVSRERPAVKHADASRSSRAEFPERSAIRRASAPRTLTTRGAGGTQVNGYLAARPTRRSHPGDDRDPRGDGPERAHPRRGQPLPTSARRARRRLCTRAKAAAASRDGRR